MNHLPHCAKLYAKRLKKYIADAESAIKLLDCLLFGQLLAGTFQPDAQKVKCPWEGHFILAAPTYAALARAAE